LLRLHAAEEIMNERDEEAFEEQPRPRAPKQPAADNERVEDRPRRRDSAPRDRGPSARAPRDRQERDRDDRDDDDYEDRPRRRRRSRESDPIESLIPYNNGMALAAYYCGVFSLIPCAGAVLGPLAIVFGILGLRKVSANPEARGTGHAITGIVLGSLVALGHLIVLIIFVASSQRW
jgi:hypothetical protein